MDSKAIIVLGAQYGDEAKGNLTDYLTNNYDIKYVIRFNGGANAGHTIIIDNKTIDTHLYPSGIATDKVINIIGNGVLMNITSFLWETFHLNDKNINIDYIIKHLIISYRAHVTLLCQQFWDYSTNKIGTTNKGIGPTMACKGLRVAMRMEDFLNDNYINKINEMYEYINSFIKWEPYTLTFPQLDNDYNFNTNIKFETLQEMMEYELKIINHNIHFIRSIIKDTISYINNIDKNDAILFEGANAFGLDTDFGTYPCVTSTSCISSACMSGTGISIKNLIERNFKIIGVFKAYITRVGSGSFPTYQNNEWSDKVQNIGKEYGVTTGRKRNCGHLDLVQLAHSALINGYDELNITKLDVLCFANEINICIDYCDKNGNIINDFPSCENKMKEMFPIYKKFDGWNITSEELKQIKKYDDLPINIKNFIDYIEDYLYKRIKYHINIKYINTSYSRNDKIIK